MATSPQSHDQRSRWRIAHRGRCLAGWCGLVEANPVGGGVDELHLSDVSGTWADARIEERVSVLVEFVMQCVDVAYLDEHGRPWRSVVVMRGQVEPHTVARDLQ